MDAPSPLPLRYARLIQLATSSPWAILPEKLHAIGELLADRAVGIAATTDQIGAALSQQRTDARPQPGAVAMLPIMGTIIPRASLFSEFSGGTSAEYIRQFVTDAAASPQVASILLQIDSPGGNVQGIQEAAAAIREAARRKPVYAIADGTAASAAYWLGSQATEFVASPSSIVGSIGVLSVHQDITGRLEQQGVGVEFITAGKYKAEGALGPLSEEARAHGQSLVDGIYAQMVSDIAAGRGVAPSTIEAQYGQGRVYLAPEALRRGMVDGIETFDSLLARVVPAATPARAPRAELEPAEISAAFAAVTNPMVSAIAGALVGHE